MTEEEILDAVGRTTNQVIERAGDLWLLRATWGLRPIVYIYNAKSGRIESSCYETDYDRDRYLRILREEYLAI